MSKQQTRVKPESEWIQPCADAVIQNTRCNESDRIFSVNGFTKRHISIIEQQRRASHLAWALVQRGVVTRTHRVAIIGGGFAGLTCAVGLAIGSGCYVEILEKRPVLLERFKSAAYRYLHPDLTDSVNPFDWWYSDANETFEPFLNWKPGYAPMVAVNFETKFMAYCQKLRITLTLDSSVTKVAEGGQFVELQVSSSDARPRDLIQADVAIIASGFGSERSLPGLPDSSYWYSGNPNSYKSRYRTGSSKRERVAIAGNGDSGLMELFHYAIRDFRQDEMIYLSPFSASASYDAEVSKIQLRADPSYTNFVGWWYWRRPPSADAEAAASIELADIFASCTRDDRDWLSDRINRSFDVVLFGRSRTAFNMKQSQRNQFLLAKLAKLESFRYVCCELNLERDCTFDNGLYEIVGEPFERVVVRMGASLNSFESNVTPTDKYIDITSLPEGYGVLDIRQSMLSDRRARNLFKVVEGFAPDHVPDAMISSWLSLPGFMG
jgi:hypothetical protein